MVEGTQCERLKILDTPEAETKSVTYLASYMTARKGPKPRAADYLNKQFITPTSRLLINKRNHPRDCNHTCCMQHESCFYQPSTPITEIYPLMHAVIIDHRCKVTIQAYILPEIKATSLLEHGDKPQPRLQTAEPTAKTGHKPGWVSDGSSLSNR